MAKKWRWILGGAVIAAALLFAGRQYQAEIGEALFARAVGEKLDQVFIGGAEQVGKLEVVIDKLNFVKVFDEFSQVCIFENFLVFYFFIKVNTIFQDTG